MANAYPKSLTSYDLLKALALIIMVVDHIGNFFYPDVVWLRMIGRLCVPMWFFLIGYANTTEIPKSFWGAACVAAAFTLITGGYVFALNIIFSMIIVRYSRNFLASNTFRNTETLAGVFFVLAFMAIPTGWLFEYGSLGMLLALTGYMVRHRADIETRIAPYRLYIFSFGVYLAFFLTQTLVLDKVSSQQSIFLMYGLFAVAMILRYFRPMAYEKADHYIAPSVIGMIQALGRHTLWFYVIHISLFRVIAMFLFPDEHGFLAWQFINEDIAAMFL